MGAALRRGGHSVASLLEGGFSSLNRAYNARFTDEARQAALDILLKMHHRLPRVPKAPERRRAPCGQLTVGVITWNLHGKRCWAQPGVLRALVLGICGERNSAGNKPADLLAF